MRLVRPPARVSTASPIYGIEHRLEVFRVHATTMPARGTANARRVFVVTHVVDDVSLGDRTERLLVRDAVSELVLSALVRDPVALVLEPAGPRDAWSIDHDITASYNRCAHRASPSAVCFSDSCCSTPMRLPSSRLSQGGGMRSFPATSASTSTRW
jgi:hypothetical protein